MVLAPLPQVASYFPLDKGRFTVAPGLFPISTSFDNGAMDTRLFQIDQEYWRFRENILAARRENLRKYVCREPEFARTAPDVCCLLMIRLSVEYPEYFHLDMHHGGAGVFQCRLTGESFEFDQKMQIVSMSDSNDVYPPYEDMWDALISQVPEDFAVVSLPDGTSDSNIALHVCCPSHWAVAEKSGKSFLQTHIAVPHFERIAKASATLMEVIRTRPPFVRFNWGIEFTDRLNLHPNAPELHDSPEWNRRRLASPDDLRLYLRIERQILWGMGDYRLVLFGIRIYTRRVDQLSPDERLKLYGTLLSMPVESRRYKGMSDESYDEVLTVIERLDQAIIVQPH